MDIAAQNNPSLKDVRAKAFYPALLDVHQEPISAEYVNPYGFLPIVVPGGIGDLIVSIPLLDAIKKKVGRIRVYTIHPEVMRYFGRGEDLGPENPRPAYLYYLKLSTAPVWFYKGRIADSIPELQDQTPVFDLFTDTRRSNSPIARFSAYQPNFDGELAQEAIQEGLDRFSLGAWMLRLETPRYPVLKPRADPREDISPFITLNTGFDSTQIDVGMRSTKSWGMRSWALLVEKLKTMRPDVWIVQIGGKNSRAIPGVDENLAGQMSLEKSLNLLSKSRLHIDTEGGLVHAAHAMGVRSVVIFGPTPPKFFGYSDNINLSPEECGGCWWTNRWWMEKCPLFEGPKCMDSVNPDKVYFAAIIALQEELKC